jgi:hypothetical protein
MELRPADDGLDWATGSNDTAEDGPDGREPIPMAASHSVVGGWVVGGPPRPKD